MNENKPPLHPHGRIVSTNHRVSNEPVPHAAPNFNFTSFLRQNYISFGLFLCGVLTMFVVIVWGAVYYTHTEISKTSVINAVPHSIDQLFNAPPPPLPPQSALSQKTFDILFRLEDGTLFDVNDTSTRVFDLGFELADMDVISIMFFTCCCNDKTIVICDNRQPPSVAGPLHTTNSPPTLTDYSVSCYLSHDPSVPAMNTDRNRYRHRWKLIVQFGIAFYGSGSNGADCTFSATYHTNPRVLPPPPIPPANSINKKIW